MFLNKVKVLLCNHYFFTFVSDVKSVVSSHEQVQSSWEESVSKHLNSRKSLFITYKHQNVRFNPITTLKQRYEFYISLSSLINDFLSGGIIENSKPILKRNSCWRVLIKTIQILNHFTVFLTPRREGKWRQEENVFSVESDLLLIEAIVSTLNSC